ncbi:M48 family metallopeptidase [Roseivivax sp. CAU 1753]
MGVIELRGNPPIAVILRRSAQARKISLRLSGIDGRVTLTLPRSVPEREGLAFLHEKEPWLRGHLERRAEPIAIGPGAVLPVEGIARTIRPGPGRRIALTATELLVPGPAPRIAARLHGHLKGLARDRLAAASDRYAAALGRSYSRITLRDTRSRWGSCSSQGALSYSWRLILAPPDVLDYVAAHEVAHLAHMNHSARFWDAVSALYGDWQGPRRWLREQGADLHRYRFDD